MRITEELKKIPADKIIFVIGIIGMILILISSFIPDKKEEKSESENLYFNKSGYLEDIENRLEDFLENMEGVGNADVMITLKGGEFYTYIYEDKKSISENRTETDKSYVMSGREKTPVLETVNNPEIKGAVIACEGASEPSVKSDVYNTVSKALGISTADIYVTELK